MMVFLSALIACAYLLSAAVASAVAGAVPDPAAASPRGPSPLEADVVASRWPGIASLVTVAARGLYGASPRDGPLSSAGPAEQAPAAPEGDGWEARFARGLHCSKAVTESREGAAGRWVVDTEGSGAGVPAEMQRAEELLRRAAEDAPAKQQREKTAELALRLYNHAKWLAEQNLAKAAEWRYREAFRLARQSRRSVLAAHALSRLGYFLMHWRREDEAREVLRQSEQISKKSNPLAPYLYGILERRAAGADAERLRSAEERILNSQEQPSEDLESERQQLLREIDYWRAAETAPRQCFDTFDAARLVTCLLGHAAFSLR